MYIYSLIFPNNRVNFFYNLTLLKSSVLHRVGFLTSITNSMIQRIKIFIKANQNYPYYSINYCISKSQFSEFANRSIAFRI